MHTLPICSGVHQVPCFAPQSKFSKLVCPTCRARLTVGERRTALEELRMLFARARAPFVINMWEGEAKVGLVRSCMLSSICLTAFWRV